LGWNAKPNDCTSVGNYVKQDCTSNDISNNDFVNNLSNRMCDQVMANPVCSVRYPSSKDHVTKTAVNKTTGRIRRELRAKLFCGKTVLEAIV